MTSDVTPNADYGALVAVGVEYCVAHDGIRYEEDEVCDFYYSAQQAEDNEADACDFRQLYYLSPNDGSGT